MSPAASGDLHVIWPDLFEATHSASYRSQGPACPVELELGGQASANISSLEVLSVPVTVPVTVITSVVTRIKRKRRSASRPRVLEARMPSAEQYFVAPSALLLSGRVAEGTRCDLSRASQPYFRTPQEPEVS